MRLKAGVAFSDYIISEKPRSRKSQQGGDKYNKVRVFFMPSLLVLVSIIIFFRLFTLQVIQGSYYKDLADNNRIRTAVIHAPRGIIFDRNKIPLVFNIPGFREIVNGKTKMIDNEKAITLIAQGKKDLEIDTLRSYPYREIFAHVVGYIGQISEEELRRPQFSNYKGGDLIGKMGIEQEYEALLKGVDGKQLFETDSLGKLVRKLGQTDPVPGRDLIFTLDAKLQKTAFEALRNVKRGAVIASTPRGEVLVIVSKPSFDPNLFTMGQGYKSDPTSEYQKVEEVLSDSKNQPLLNRAISGTYPPGSTFKLVVAAAGLENKIIDRHYEVEDTGIINVGPFSFSNWYFSQYGRKDGMVNVVKGIKRSNDIFFYKLSEKIGVETISKTAKMFGLGARLGIDLYGEAAGIVPTPLWKEKEFREPWYLGDTYNYGIGQGFILTTPLQVNIWTQAIANNGTIYRPHLLLKTKPDILKKKLLSPDSADLIRRGMIESCSPGGVAWPLFNFTVKNSKLEIDGKNFMDAPQATVSADFKDYRKVTLACKTGTAQYGKEETLPHAWITLFAPAYDPQIVVTVLAEESGEGSNIAAPIAKKILEEWFSR